MMNKRFLITALAISACTAGLSMNAPKTFAEEGSVEGLPPIVMILFDTSGSMDYCYEDGEGKPVGNAEYFCQHYITDECNDDAYVVGGRSYAYVNGDCTIAYTDSDAGNTRKDPCHEMKLKSCKGIRKGCTHTRLTKAIAEIAGAPRRLNGGLNQLITSNEQQPIRAYYTCEDGTCHYDYARYAPSANAFDSAYTDGNNFGIAIGSDGNPIPLTPSRGTEKPNQCILSTYHYCVSKYDESFFGGNESDLKAHDSAYNNDGVIQAYKSDVKFGFSGFDYTGKTNFIYGFEGSNSVSDKYKKKVSNGKGNFGISNADPLSQAPLMYPAAQDDATSIINRNNAVATSVRGYWAGGGTPIGPALADLYYLFTQHTSKPASETYPDNVKYQKYNDADGNIKFYEDTKYDCRDKAVILITDGAPSERYGVIDTNEKGQGARVWEDVKRLFQNNIKTYVVGYSILDVNPRKQPKLKANGKLCEHGDPTCQFCEDDVANCDLGESDAYKHSTEDLDEYAGDILNRLAWQGGTCQNPVTLDIVDPNQPAEYKALLEQCPSVSDTSEVEDAGTKGRYWKCSCFFNASTSTGLRTALVTVLSDMLKGTYSKTKLATTTAISKNIGTTGYYNVYSGYQVSTGAIRKTKLEREAIICDDSNQKFVNKEEKYLNLAHRLQCRLTTCDVWRPATAEDVANNHEYKEGMNYKFTDTAGTQFSSQPASCAQQVEEPSLTGTNTCVNDRYIFAANYNKADDQFAISLINSFLTRTALHETGSDAEIGVIPQGTNKDPKSYIMSAGDDCNNQKTTKTINDFATEANYLLSPYECYNDLDCGINGNKNRRCDLGRCLDPDKYESATTCNADTTFPDGNHICIAGLVRPKGAECTTHSDCSEGTVCHAGSCVAGTVKACDLRQFIASQPLGTIEYASPVTFNPPRMAYKSSEYRAFKSNYASRDTLLMVGANDGMMHAFVLGKNSGQGYYSNLRSQTASYTVDEGDEAWAFIPKAIMPNLKQLPNYGQQAFINGTPTIADVHLPATGTANNIAQTKINGTSWRSVMVGGFKNGARGYYALDITDPKAPIVLWEIDNHWQAAGTPEETFESTTNETTSVAQVNASYEASSNYRLKGFPFVQMGLSSADPVITNMLIGDKVEPVAILPGGSSESTSNDDMTGRALYIVRLYPTAKENLLVKTFYFKNRITGTPAVYPNNFNSVAQHIYVGDEKGKLYRLNVKSNDISNWKSYDEPDENNIIDSLNSNIKLEQPAFDLADDIGLSEDFSKITFAPAVSLYKQVSGAPTIQVAFGTGENDDFNIDTNAYHYFASFIDKSIGGKYVFNPTNNTDGFSPMVYLFNAPGIVNNEDSGIKTEEYIQPTGKNYKYLLTEKEHPLLTSEDQTELSYSKLLPMKMTTAPITYNFDTYFATFSQSSGSHAACPTGKAYIWRIQNNTTNRWGTLKQAAQNANDKDPFYDEGKYHSYVLAADRINSIEITEQMTCGTGSNKKTYAPELVFLSGKAPTLDNPQTGSAGRNAHSSIHSGTIALDTIAAQVNPLFWASVYE